jgi:hypothetical protein
MRPGEQFFWEWTTRLAEDRPRIERITRMEEKLQFFFPIRVISDIRGFLISLQTEAPGRFLFTGDCNKLVIGLSSHAENHSSTKDTKKHEEGEERRPWQKIEFGQEK